MKRWYLLIIVLLSTSTMAQVYVQGGFGYARYVSPFLNNLKKIPAGLDMILLGGYKYDFVAGEAFVGKSDMQVQINHNRTDYYLHYKDTYFGLGPKFFLDMFFLKFGFAFHQLTPSVNDFSSNSIMQTGAVSTYYSARGIKQNATGFYFGFGLDLFLTENIAAWGDTTLYDLNISGANIFALNLGLKYSFGK